MAEKIQMRINQMKALDVVRGHYKTLAACSLTEGHLNEMSSSRVENS